MDWKKRGAKIVSVFSQGYGAGLASTASYAVVGDGTSLNYWLIFGLPLISGLIGAWQQFGKVMAEYANS